MVQDGNTPGPADEPRGDGNGNAGRDDEHATAITPSPTTDQPRERCSGVPPAKAAAPSWLRDQMIKVLVPTAIGGLVLIASVLWVVPRITDSVVSKATEQIKRLAESEAQLEIQFDKIADIEVKLRIMNLEFTDLVDQYNTINDQIVRLNNLERVSEISPEEMSTIADAIVKASKDSDVLARLIHSENRIKRYEDWIGINDTHPDTPITINVPSKDIQVEIRAGVSQFYFQSGGGIYVMNSGKPKWEINPDWGFRRLDQ